jgi:hypothetical protein
MNDKAIMQPESGMTAIQTFGGDQSLAQSGETLSTVLAAQAEAETKMRFFLAQQRPRSMDMVRTSLLAACERPGFAGGARERDSSGGAWYHKPVGKGVQGFSIRFAEEVIRCYQNLDVSSSVIYENEKFRIVNVKVVDLETNISFPTQLVVEKTVERSQLKRGQTAISKRLNSKNEPVYTVEATPDEVLQRQNSLISKAIRNAVLRLVPGDILHECKERILAIRRGDQANDPAAYRKYLCDKYSQIGVMPVDLEEYLGHSLNNISPPEQNRLEDLYDEIVTKNLSWADVVEVKSVGEKPKKPKDLTELVEQQKQSPPRQGIDVQAEVEAVAKDMWPQEYKTVVCKKASAMFKQDIVTIEQMTPKQLSDILDDLNEIRTNQGGAI